ncbi:MAG: hypothetical protein A2175_01015 [Candidatus Nealsonbacteria bacterium RBG_13_42_11]|uniref:AB hydrolase-1 domain-containing protein n=1 Tax=Candidatus Nealsonbacteria bacterium RBG_13_42_11 TaxID=1801663 RepID=A0A1G2DYA2_9BACT|nr:MAG: hypothetical protein A2175_01015 [Candidatus Nealsonbacteria bacterium RBG_13_42_11]
MTPILILRGWGSKIENWKTVIGLLENQGYKVFSPDLPGFGQNSPPETPWGVDDYVNWVSDFCTKNNLSKFFLVGHSFGGGIALKYAVKHPQNPQKLIFADAAISRTQKPAKEAIGKVAGALKKFSFLPFYSKIRKIAYQNFLKSDYPLEEGVMRQTYLKVFSEDLREHLSKVKIPTMIIWGEKDDATPTKDAYLIKEKIQGADLEILPGIHHHPNSECPEKLATLIANFLKWN